MQIRFFADFVPVGRKKSYPASLYSVVYPPGTAVASVIGDARNEFDALFGKAAFELMNVRIVIG